MLLENNKSVTTTGVALVSPEGDAKEVYSRRIAITKSDYTIMLVL